MKAWLKPTRLYVLPSFLFLGYFSTLWMVLAFIPLYLTDIGFSHLQIGILISTFPVASLIFMFPFGVFSDRLSPKKLITAGLVIMALFLFGLRYASGFWSYLALFALGGIGGALFRISLFSLYYKFLGEQSKGAKLGLLLGLGLLGYGLGPLVGGLLLRTLDLDSLLLVATFVLLVPISASFFLKDATPRRFDLREYGRDIKKKEVIILTSLVFLLATHIGVEQTSFSLFLKHESGLVEDTIGIMFFIIGIAIATLSFANGLVSDKVSGRGRSLGFLLYLGMLISGAFNMLMLFPRTFASVLTVRLFHVLGDSTFIVAQRVVVSNLFPAERIGGNLGLLDVVQTSGMFAGMLISGIIPGYMWPFVVMGALSVLAIIPAMALRPKF